MSAIWPPLNLKPTSNRRRRKTGFQTRRAAGGQNEPCNAQEIQRRSFDAMGQRHGCDGGEGICFPFWQHGHGGRLRPVDKRGGAVGDPAMQWRAILANIKSDLEELGSSLEHLGKLTFYVKGPFPDGGVLSSPNFRLDVLDEFFAQHCPKHCSYNTPPPSEVIGVSALAHPDLVIEIVAIAELPN